MASALASRTFGSSGSSAAFPLCSEEKSGPVKFGMFTGRCTTSEASSEQKSKSVGDDGFGKRHGCSWKSPVVAHSASNCTRRCHPSRCPILRSEGGQPWEPFKVMLRTTRKERKAEPAFAQNGHAACVHVPCATCVGVSASHRARACTRIVTLYTLRLVRCPLSSCYELLHSSLRKCFPHQ